MFSASLTIALAMVLASWIAATVVLAFSTRRSDPAQGAYTRLAAKSAPWRALPDNRVLPMAPRSVGPVNDSSMRDGSFDTRRPT